VQRFGADIINMINQKRLHIIITSANNEVISHVFDANLVMMYSKIFLMSNNKIFTFLVCDAVVVYCFSGCCHGC